MSSSVFSDDVFITATEYEIYGKGLDDAEGGKHRYRIRYDSDLDQIQIIKDWVQIDFSPDLWSDIRWAIDTVEQFSGEIQANRRRDT